MFKQPTCCRGANFYVCVVGDGGFAPLMADLRVHFMLTG
jgi:hypothetical protein